MTRPLAWLEVKSVIETKKAKNNNCLLKYAVSGVESVCREKQNKTIHVCIGPISAWLSVCYSPRPLGRSVQEEKKKNGNSVYNTKKLRHSFHKRNNEENSAHLVSISSDVNAGTTERTKTKPQKREITQLSRGQKQVKEGLC